MIIRHALPSNLKISQDKIDYSYFNKTKDELNDWFFKKISELKKPIKRIEFMGAEFDMGNNFAIGLKIELED